MIPGELLVDDGEIVLNEGRETTVLRIDNRGDRPIQVGSHTHVFEVNAALAFDRDAAYGRRLDIPAGTALRFEPGESREVTLVPFAGSRRVFGMNALVNGDLDARRETARAAAREAGFAAADDADDGGAA